MRLGALAATFAAVAAQGTWKIIANDVGTIATGIAFNADGKTGFLPADSNGVGSSILKSTDGGLTWDYSAPHPFSLLYLDIASAGNNVVASGVLGVDYSIDAGETFNASLTNEVAAQCTRNLYNHDNPAGFGIVGQFGLFNPVNGVGISEDFGITFTTFDANASSDARYGSFPSETTWYVASGDWPNSGAAAAEEIPAGHALVKKLTEKVWLLKEEATGKHVHHWATRAVTKGKGGRKLQTSTGSTSTQPTTTSGGGGPDEYLFQITKTADGGKTWSTLLNITGEIYPNGIECSDENTCCLVAEADSGDYAGSYIYCTQDGTNWAQTYNNTDPGSSLMDIAYDGQYMWAVGGEFNQVGPAAAHFLYSADGGKTWAMGDADLPNVYATSVDCVPTFGTCWSTVLSLLQESDVVSNGNFTAAA